MWYSQCSLVIINSVFALAGLLMFIFGCMILVGSDRVQEYLITSMSRSSSFVKSLKSEHKQMDFNFEVYLRTGAYIMSGMGVCFLIVSLFGCCGSLKKIRWCLIFYAVVVSLLIATKVALAVLVAAFPGKVADVFREPMYTSLRNEYRGLNSSDTISFGWNYIMISLQCCGVMNYQDFRSANQWHGNITVPGQPINGSTEHNSEPITVLLTTPIACCKTSGSFLQTADANNITCAISPNQVNSNMNQGCLDSIMQKVKEYYIYLAITTSFIVIFEIVMLIIVIRLLEAIKSQLNYDKEIQRMFIDN